MKNHELVQGRDLIEMSTPEELIHLHKKCEPLSLYFVAVTKVYPIAGQL
jgi:hypothetical protein